LPGARRCTESFVPFVSGLRVGRGQARAFGSIPGGEGVLDGPARDTAARARFARPVDVGRPETGVRTPPGAARSRGLATPEGSRHPGWPDPDGGARRGLRRGAAGLEPEPPLLHQLDAVAPTPAAPPGP